MHVVWPRLGRLKLHESARKLSGRIDNGTARILSGTVRCEGGCWFASFTCEVERTERTPVLPDRVAAVDLGIKSLAVLWTGEVIDNPRHLGSALKGLRRQSRTVSRRIGPDRRTGQRASNRWKRADERRSRAHARVANLRRDALQKLTTDLASTFGTVVIEDLNVVGMVKNRKLARHIADASFSEIRRQLTDQTAWNSGRLIVADRWFPSSKTCSGCGAVKTTLALSERTYECQSCGLSIDRDFNAALNLAALTREADVTGSGPATRNGRGADQKTPFAGQVAVKRQPGTAQAVQTGTVPPQSGTAGRELTHAS